MVTANPIRYPPLAIRLLLDNYQRFAEFDRLAVLDKNLRDGAGARRWNLVHRFHRFDDQQRLPDRYLAADFDERPGAWLRWPICGAEPRRWRRPATITAPRLIVISFRRVSSRGNACCQISAVSSPLNFAAVVSSGWLA